MSIDLQTQYHDEDLMGYNTTAEIPGTDPKLKDEIVMLVGHMDSWHSSTGATDNAAGVAVAMEAARIIQTLGLKPRRTIRVALWTVKNKDCTARAIMSNSISARCRTQMPVEQR